ncbi:MAG: UDP-N-acetylmuramate--L-alanine ligase [Gammaproteobacteria bacterium]|nr:UDP-N-acetylmuramate--L-alanine ligase [Gammaproteobacteria bacterium]
MNSGQFMRRIKCVHLIGIGGAGMGGIAEVLLNLGYQVTGSDLAENALTRRLHELGATVMVGHSPQHVAQADVVVVSTAVADENVELCAAREARIPIVPRAEMLAELMRFRRGIAIAGTHGKTTTTSLVASLLGEGGLDPTYVIGGRLLSSGSNARLGQGDYLVAEADESDASFLYLQPVIAVVTNIDADHLSTYGGDFDTLRGTFVEFLHHLPFYGLAVLCIDDAQVRGILPQVTRPITTYGFAEDADVRAVGIRQSESQTRFDVLLNGVTVIADAVVALPGKHNVLNALAAVAVALELGIALEVIRSGLASFGGIGRRLQSYGEIQSAVGPVLLIDDYAHHPREIEASCEAIRSGWPARRLVVAFQPHRYTRTHELLDDFAKVLSASDALLITEVYAAGEAPISGADARALCRAVRARGKVDPVFVEDLEQLGSALRDVIAAQDVVLTLGAGSIGAQVPRLRDELRSVQ